MGDDDLEEIGGQEDAVYESEDQEEGQHVQHGDVERHQESQAGQDGGDEHHGTAVRHHTLKIFEIWFLPI